MIKELESLEADMRNFINIQTQFFFTRKRVDESMLARTVT
jgi:hypothetical protein